MRQHLRLRRLPSPRPRRTLPGLPAALALVVALATRAQAQPPPATVTLAGHEASLTVGGLLQVQADFGDPGDSRFGAGNDRFYLRRARLNASGKLNEQIDFRLEIELAGSLGAASGLRAQATDAYVDWHRYPAVSVRVGQFKTPFGFEQLYSDPRLPTIERTLANDRLTLSRQIGVQAGGDLLDRRLSWATGLFNGNGTNTSANDNNHFLWAGRLSGQPWRGRLLGEPATLSVGAGAYSSEDVAVSLPDLGFDSTPATSDRDNLFTGKRRGTAFDAELVGGRFEVWAEALRGRFEPTNRLPRAAFDAEGWSALASWFLLPKRLQVVLRREGFDPSSAASRDTTTTDTLGVNWFFKGHDLKLMVDYLRVAVDQRARDEDKVLARLQVLF